MCLCVCVCVAREPIHHGLPVCIEGNGRSTGAVDTPSEEGSRLKRTAAGGGSLWHTYALVHVHYREKVTPMTHKLRFVSNSMNQQR